MKIRLVICAATAFVAGCSSKPGGNDRDTMTQRQRDSVFGQSAVPGAGAVTKAQAAADSLDAQRKRADSAARADTNSR